uniref:RBR-type E3 ubiquitin transferase n=1 Tax=Oryza nivara TaxID=4536 RepID=A0A0E0GQP4_ORYNI
MASDRRYYYFEEDDGDGEEEVEWLAMEADEDDVGLLEEDDLHLRLPDDRPADCWAITQESLPAAQQQDLSMVMNLLNIKQHLARTLLIHHRWKMHCIYDHLDRKGRDRMLSEACIILPKNSMSAASSTSVTCNVCFEDFPMTDVSTMDCGHCFCNDCWTEHFFASINTGNKQIRCMEVKCKAICDEDIVRRLLSLKYPAASKRFDLLLLESYLEDNDSVKWCPSAPHCGRAIQVGTGERYCEVACPCGVSFCFNCAGQVHSPCPCAIWEKWKAKGHGDSDSVKWILANTKSCPKCSKPIEKNGGCNLVHCKCGQCLCWLCGGPTGREHTWDSISGHSCNRYKEENGDKVDTSRQQMQRYTHYWDRYNIHAGSYKVEQKDLGPAVEEQVKKLELNLTGPKMNWDGSWLAMAYQSLLASRQVLSRSYAFAYYMFGGGEVKTHTSERASLAVAQNLFEDRQEQLERHVEHLSKVLATDLLGLPEEEIVLKKVEIANLAKIVQAICGQLYRCIQDELLPLLVQPMNIAAYQPDGPDKAKEFIGA